MLQYLATLVIIIKMNKMKNLWKFYFINILTSSKREEQHLKQKYQDTSRKLVIFADFLATEVDETHTDGKRTNRTTLFSLVMD